MEKAIIFVSLLILLHIPQTYSAEISIISDSQFLTAEDTLVSQDRTFVLGFFKPNGTENTYLGIWYKKISVHTVVWVANRDRPLTGTSPLGVVKMADPGNLVIMNNVTNHVLWSSNTTSSGNTIAKLLDTGNLVVTNGNQNKILWMSFDYPTDTLLPGMTLGRNFVTGQEWYLSSWKNSQDPAPGNFTWITDTHGYPQHLLKQGAVVKYRGGPWNGERFSGSVYVQNTIFTYNMVINKTEVSYTYNLVNSSVLSRSTLSSSGKWERSVWVEERKIWQAIFVLPKDNCDYNICGAYGRCVMTSLQTCLCLDEKKFIPRNPKNWETADWSGGCVRKTPLDCKNKSDGFKRYSNVKLPDTQTSWYNMSMTLKECKTICLNNCTCMAYANTDIRGEGSGCLLWFNDLKDIKLLSEGMGGQDIFIRMASSDLDKGGTNIKIILMVAFLTVFVLGLSSAWFCYTWRKKHNSAEFSRDPLQVHESNKEAIELPLFNFSTIEKATACFSLDNKLGEGGFGAVYKGILEGGGEIAVKRLSHTSSQGLDEFKNEVICITKLQHRNLVKLLGCSIEGDEKLLIYEYMPNKSLDSFIFDKIRSTLLDWTKRFHIIEGIARGILYLHQDSRLRIIHRDLKASNILLDLDMNPKISDFGIARCFGGNENEANTERVVGTYGYMSPEYALNGVFSTKSDVFSFGVLMLEIISGKRNRGFIHSDHSNNLIGHAWTMHNEGRSLELFDTNLEEAINPSEVLRSIEVALLCVQQNPEDRPNMSSVVRMLGNELGALQKPKQPAFFIERSILAADGSSSNSTNYLTVTEANFIHGFMHIGKSRLHCFQRAHARELLRLRVGQFYRRSRFYVRPLKRKTPQTFDLLRRSNPVNNLTREPKGHLGG